MAPPYPHRHPLTTSIHRPEVAERQRSNPALRQRRLPWRSSRCAGMAQREGCGRIVAVQLQRRGVAIEGANACDGSQCGQVVTESSPGRHATRVESGVAAHGDPVRGGPGRGAWALSNELSGPVRVPISPGIESTAAAIPQRNGRSETRDCDPPLQRQSPVRLRHVRWMARRVCRRGENDDE